MNNQRPWRALIWICQSVWIGIGFSPTSSICASDLSPAGAPVEIIANEASQAWRKIETRFSAAGVLRPPARESGLQALAEAKASRAAELSTVADLAKDFYQRYTQHRNANEARKIEVLALLYAAIMVPSYGERLETAAQLLRADKSVLETTRAEVVASYEFQWVNRGQENRAEAREVTARKLIIEFPKMPQGYESLLTIAYQNEAPKSRALANEIIAGTPPSHIAMRTHELLARLNLVGKYLAEILQQAGAENAQAALKPGQPTIIYTWRERSLASTSIGNLLVKYQSAGVNILGLNLDRDIKQAKAFAESHQLPGFLYYATSELSDPLVEGLRMTSAPLVYMVDEKGVICDVLGVNNLAGKISSLGQKP